MPRAAGSGMRFERSAIAPAGAFEPSTASERPPGTNLSGFPWRNAIRSPTLIFGHACPAVGRPAAKGPGIHLNRLRAVALVVGEVEIALELVAGERQHLGRPAVVRSFHHPPGQGPRQVAL